MASSYGRQIWQNYNWRRYPQRTMYCYPYQLVCRIPYGSVTFNSPLSPLAPKFVPKLNQSNVDSSYRNTRIPLSCDIPLYTHISMKRYNTQRHIKTESKETKKESKCVVKNVATQSDTLRQIESKNEDINGCEHCSHPEINVVELPQVDKAELSEFPLLSSSPGDEIKVAPPLSHRLSRSMILDVYSQIHNDEKCYYREWMNTHVIEDGVIDVKSVGFNDSSIFARGKYSTDTNRILQRIEFQTSITPDVVWHRYYEMIRKSETESTLFDIFKITAPDEYPYAKCSICDTRISNNVYVISYNGCFFSFPQRAIHYNECPDHPKFTKEFVAKIEQVSDFAFI